MDNHNNKTYEVIKLLVVFGDFVLYNLTILFIFKWTLFAEGWQKEVFDQFLLINNMALLAGQFFFSTIVYQRLIGAGDILKRVVRLTVTQALLGYLFLRLFDIPMRVGWLQFYVGIVFFLLLLVKRLIERFLVRLYRESGKNTRTATFVGSDPELINIYNKLKGDSTLGYSILGYYADNIIGTETHTIGNGNRHDNNISESSESQSEYVENGLLGEDKIKHLGTINDFVNRLNNPESLILGDELYVCLSRRDKRIIKKISRMCDNNLVRFFYVPVSVETLGLNLRREMLDDLEVFTTYDIPLQNTVNKIIKRAFDIIMSLLFLIPTAILFPFIFIIIKIQSPGPIIFKQQRTGLDGKAFNCYKFRSMHVNADADTVQATKDDPRKFPFGDFMRKTNIDELPQFFNVLQGRMSVVGPRPHMLAHTEQYSKLIEKYMIRHFVKPGVTGWAQVTGYRGETKELWQMEGRVKRDIWYIEHWSIWLDFRIIWMTVKKLFDHDENAY